MTTVVGLIDLQGRTYIGMDGRQTAGSKITTEKTQKWFTPTQGVVVASAGTVGTIQLLQRSVKWSGLADVEPEDLEPWGIDVLAPQLRSCLRKHKINRDDDGCAFLIGIPGGLMTVDTYCGMTAYNDPGDYCAIGTGGAFACGALGAISRRNGQRAIKKALSVALKLDSASGGKCTIHSLE